MSAFVIFCEALSASVCFLLFCANWSAPANRLVYFRSPAGGALNRPEFLPMLLHRHCVWGDKPRHFSDKSCHLEKKSPGERILTGMQMKFCWEIYSDHRTPAGRS